MADIKKNFSDFQKNECDSIEVEQPIDERLCPTCFPNPNFSLPDYWYNIREAYLNEEFCEYHVRVYASEAEKHLASEDLSVQIRDAAISLGIKKILVEFDKLLNDGVVEELKKTASIVNSVFAPNQRMLGEAFLVAIPSINFDQTPDLEDESENKEQTSPPDEILLQYDGLFRKTIQLGSALRVYKMFYAAAHQIGDNKGITLVYKEDLTKRFDYESVRESLKRFRVLLNQALRSNNYEGIDYPSFIRKKYDKIKIILDSSKPYVIESIYVLDQSCDSQYVKLKISGPSLELLGHGFETVLGLLANLDLVMNDITAKETKPWLEFTLDNMYPSLVANYGDYNEINEEDYRQIGCLFEDSLGVGNGQVTNYLAKQTLSFFKVLENDMYKSACRSINDITDTEQEKQARAQTSEDLREENTKKKYKERFINEYYSQQIESAKNLAEGSNPDNKIRRINRDNFWTLATGLIQAGVMSKYYVGPSYKYKDDDDNKKEGPNPVIIQSKQALESSAANYANLRFELMDKAWSTRLANNPEWEQVRESYNEAFNPENGFLNYIFGTGSEDGDNTGIEDPRTILNTIGLCGMSKLAGKVLKCLLGGVTIEDFYDLIAEKTLEFMKFNTFDLFLNSLPSNFKQNLDRALQEQFGDIDLQQLIGIKSEEGVSLKDTVSFSSSNRIMKIFERSKDPLVDSKITFEDKEFLKNNIGDRGSEFYDALFRHYAINYDYENNQYSAGNSLDDDGEFTIYKATVPSTKRTEKEIEKEYKSCKKYTKKLVKHAKRSYLKGTDTFDQANRKLKNSIDLFGEYDRANKKGTVDSAERLRRSLNSNERISRKLNQTNMGVKVDAVYDVIFDFVVDYILDLMNADQLIQILNQFPGADMAYGFVADFFKSCPHPPLFNPPAKDFMKSFSLDVCDPELNLKMPKINFPSLSLRYNLEKQFGDNFRNAIVSLVSQIAINILKKFVNLLEDALCKTIGAVGALVGNAVTGDLKNSWEKALDELFCGGAVNPETGNSRASELSNGLFEPSLLRTGQNYEGSGDKVANIISSVVSQEDLLRAVVDGDDNVNKLISNCINSLAPEMAVLLGSPSQVATFFRNLKSYLPDEDQQRIRDMLDAGVPNLPLTSQICLTNDQLKAWNDLRKSMLEDMGVPNPEDKVRKLNEEVEKALEDVIDDVLSLDNSEGPFIGAITDEALKDACNPSNLFNDVSDSELGKQESQTLNDQEFELIMRLMMISFNGRNGIFGNAMRAKDNSREGIFRQLRKFFNANYANSQEERDAVYNPRGIVGKAVMKALTDTDGEFPDGEAIGTYPSTVGILLRDDLLANQQYNLPSKFSTTFEEGEGEGFYSSEHTFYNLDRKDSFSYDMMFIKKYGESKTQGEGGFAQPVRYSLGQAEDKFIESLGLGYKSTESYRKRIFEKLVQQRTGVSRDYSDLYNMVFEKLSSNIIEASVTNKSDLENNPLGVSTGYLFGYVGEDIKKEHWEYLNPEPGNSDHPANTPYNYDEDEKVLGKYGNTRIKILNPEVYGGRYSNPPYTVEPRKFFGWLEYATKAFESPDGCDPKRPPIFYLKDIKDRVQFLENNLRNWPEMTKDKDCVVELPFKLLIGNKARAKMDGVVRITLRAYIGEYFLRGAGTFSNIHIRSENYDSSLSSFLIERIKGEMSQLGAVLFNNRNNITQENYWYLFLEQAVQSYKTMVDLREITPPKHVLEADEAISVAQMAFEGITKMSKKEMKNLDLNSLSRPSIQDRLDILQDPALLGIYSMDFRFAIAKDSYFDPSIPIDSRITKGLIRRSSIKKLKYFSKIFAIRMYEKEAITILNELIRIEMSRLSESAYSGLNDKPLIWSLSKSFIGLKTVFENTDSNIGLNKYYLDKQLGTADTGDVPDVPLSNVVPQALSEEKPKFIVEKYIRVKSKSDIALPIQNGVVSTREFDLEISRLQSSNPNGNLSDYFGNLEFSYRGSFKELMSKGFADMSFILKLIELNKDIEERKIRDSLSSHIMGSEYEDFQVDYDASFLLEGETPEPQATTGALGVDYGLRISLILPSGYVLSEQAKRMSSSERSYIFEGATIIPMVETEVSAIDSRLDQYSTSKFYDLECLVNKMVESPLFKVLFENVFPLKMFASMSAIFNSENFMVALGRGTDERTEEALNIIENGLDEDDWEGVTNEFLKNFLRRQFRSVYLSNSIDGFTLDRLSSRDRMRLFGSFNPFDIFSLPSVKIPWFKKRRMKMKVYDANGNECADPAKDFE